MRKELGCQYYLMYELEKTEKHLNLSEIQDIFNFSNHVTILLHPMCVFSSFVMWGIFVHAVPRRGGKQLSDTGIINMC